MTLGHFSCISASLTLIAVTLMVNTVSRQKEKKDFEEKKRRIEKRCVHNKSPVLNGTVLFLPVHRNDYKAC